MTPRPYQQAAISAVARGFVEFWKQLVVMPTGAGKTILFAHLAARFLAKRAERSLVLAHREELIEQAADKIARATGIAAEVEKAERRASLDAPVVVGSIQTMQGARLERWPDDHFGLVVVDEAHHVLAESYLKALRRFDARARVLGVTATPDRADRRQLGEYFENVAYEVSLLDLIADGYLSNIRIRSIPLKLDISDVRQVAGDLDANQVCAVLAPYMDHIARVIANEIPDRKTLVFLPLVAFSQDFAAVLREHGVKAEHVDGNSPNRAELLAGFARGDFRVLCNAMLLTEGYDEPSIDCVVVLRPTKSRPLFCQMVGRGTRTHPGKSDLLLLDFLWLHERHTLIRPASLVAKSATEEASIAAVVQREGEADLQEAAETAREERAAALAREIAANRMKAESFLSLSEIASITHDPDLAEWEPSTKWEGEPPTAKQRALLAKFKVAPPPSKGAASLVINRLFQRRDAKLATVAQLKWLVRFGHPSPHTATFEEASSYLDQRFRKRVPSP